MRSETSSPLVLRRSWRRRTTSRASPRWRSDVVKSEIERDHLPPFPRHGEALLPPDAELHVLGAELDRTAREREGHRTARFERRRRRGAVERGQGRLEILHLFTQARAQGLEVRRRARTRAPR